MLSAGLLLTLVADLYRINAMSIIVPVLIFAFGSSLVMVNAAALALAPFGHIAGYVGAAYGGCQMFGSAIAASIASHYNGDPLVFLAGALSFLGLSSLLAVWLANHPKIFTKHQCSSR